MTKLNSTAVTRVSKPRTVQALPGSVKAVDAMTTTSGFGPIIDLGGACSAFSLQGVLSGSTKASIQLQGSLIGTTGTMVNIGAASTMHASSTALFYKAGGPVSYVRVRLVSATTKAGGISNSVWLAAGQARSS